MSTVVASMLSPMGSDRVIEMINILLHQSGNEKIRKPCHLMEKCAKYNSACNRASYGKLNGVFGSNGLRVTMLRTYQISDEAIQWESHHNNRGFHPVT